MMRASVERPIKTRKIHVSTLQTERNITMKHRFSVSFDFAQPVIASESSTEMTSDPLNSGFVEVSVLCLCDEKKYTGLCLIKQISDAQHVTESTNPSGQHSKSLACTMH